MARIRWRSDFPKGGKIKVSTDDVHDWLKEKPEEIRNIYEEVGDTVFDSMYEVYDPDAILFCKLADIAKKSNKMLIIHDCAWATIGKQKY